MTQRLLVTGSNGQDGVHLVDKLLRAGDDVHGMCHPAGGARRLLEQFLSVTAHVADIEKTTGIRHQIDKIEPTRVFNLAGNTVVTRSWEKPAETADVLGVGPIRLLKSCWKLPLRLGRDVRMLQASSAEIFGDASEVPPTEQTPRRPVTPYGAAKGFVHEIAGVYRARGMHVCTAILSNNQSPRRPENFVARMITMAVAKIATGRQKTVVLDNSDVKRDWGNAPDYVDAVIRIISQPASNDYIVATGVSHTVRDFAAEASTVAGDSDWEHRVVIDPAFYWPADPLRLVRNASRLRAIGWKESVTIPELVNIMMANELSKFQLDGPE